MPDAIATPGAGQPIDRQAHAMIASATPAPTSLALDVAYPSAGEVYTISVTQTDDAVADIGMAFDEVAPLGVCRHHRTGGYGDGAAGRRMINRQSRVTPYHAS